MSKARFFFSFCLSLFHSNISISISILIFHVFIAVPAIIDKFYMTYMPLFIIIHQWLFIFFSLYTTIIHLTWREHAKNVSGVQGGQGGQKTLRWCHRKYSRRRLSFRSQGFTSSVDQPFSDDWQSSHASSRSPLIGTDSRAPATDDLETKQRKRDSPLGSLGPDNTTSYVNIDCST